MSLQTYVLNCRCRIPINSKNDGYRIGDMIRCHHGLSEIERISKVYPKSPIKGSLTAHKIGQSKPVEKSEDIPF